MEAIALRGAARLVERLNEHCMVITDSEIVYKAFHGSALLRCEKIASRPSSTKHATSTRDDTCTSCRCSAHSNPADAIVKLCMNTGTGQGDEDLFGDAPYEPPTHRSARPAPCQPALDVGPVIDDIADQLLTAENFAVMRRFRARSRVPLGCEEEAFAQLAKRQLRRAITSPLQQDRNRALVGFLILPNLYLPQNVPTRRILHHLVRLVEHSTSVFKIDGAAHPDRRPDISKRAEALINDYTVHAAMRMIAAKADETTRHNFDECVATLRQKFPARQEAIEAERPIAASRFADDEVIKAIRKLSRQAATAIDAWTKDLLLAIVLADSENTALLATLLHMVMMSHGPAEDEGGRPFSNSIMDIVRAGRLIGIPKGDNDLRPIVISASRRVTTTCDPLSYRHR